MALTGCECAILLHRCTEIRRCGRGRGRGRGRERKLSKDLVLGCRAKALGTSNLSAEASVQR